MFNNLEAGLTILSTFDTLEPNHFTLSDFVLSGSNPTTERVFFVCLHIFLRHTFLYLQDLFFPAGAIFLSDNKVTFLQILFVLAGIISLSMSQVCFAKASNKLVIFSLYVESKYSCYI